MKNSNLELLRFAFVLHCFTIFSGTSIGRKQRNVAGSYVFFVFSLSIVPPCLCRIWIAKWRSTPLHYAYRRCTDGRVPYESPKNNPGEPQARLGFLFVMAFFLFNRQDFIVNNCILMTQIQGPFLDCRMIRRLQCFFVQLVHSLSQTKYTTVWK